MGNILNKDTVQYGRGFTIDSLPKLASTKASKADLSFLDLLVSLIKREESQLLDFTTELSLVPRATECISAI